MKLASKLATLLAALALPLTLAQTAMAAGTLAGTEITNQATLAYTVGTLPQPTQSSNPTKFNVDRKVNFNITYVQAAFVDVLPGSTDQALTYTVTNSGNDTQDFDLTVAQLSGGSVLGGTDNIDATAVRLFLDDGDESFDSGDTDITGSHYLDELAPDASARVFIVGNFQTPKVSGDVAGLTLAARAQHGHGSGALGGGIAEGVTDTHTGPAIYTVFADLTDTIANQEEVPGAFRIAAPVLGVAKQANVIWDPVNHDATPRSIPGAYVRYAITISNDLSALASANLTTIKDTLNANTTLDPDLINPALSAAAMVATSANGNSFQVTHDKTHTGAGRTTPTPSYYGAGSGVTVTGRDLQFNFDTLLPVEGLAYSAGELKPGESVTVTFNVKIN